MLAPRWRKVIRDLWANRLRTGLVVMAIAVGVFGFGMIEIARGVLIGELTSAYNASNPASIIMRLSPFDDDVIQAVEGMREVSVVEARARTTVSLQIKPDEWILLDIWAIDDFNSITVSQFFPEQGRMAARSSRTPARTLDS